MLSVAFAAISSQSFVSFDFLPEDQSETTISGTALFSTFILFCSLNSVISGNEDKPSDTNAEVNYQKSATYL